MFEKSVNLPHNAGIKAKAMNDTPGKDYTTVSQGCTNTAQPGLETLIKIAGCLNVDARELIVKTNHG